jgi:aryl-alcohol dehydrogenase-like predicted oxidoreductase
MTDNIKSVLKNTPVILGTAQIINNYGITNNYKRTVNQALDILNVSNKLGIFTYDTSKVYLDAHKTIETFIKKDFEKFCIIEKLNSNDIAIYDKESRPVHWPWLNTYKLNGGTLCLMLHNGIDYLNKACRKNLQNCKEKGLANFIGISVYDPDILNKCLNYGGFDLVQCPVSIADRRFCNTKLLKKINDQNIIINMRSIFLQGLLLKMPQKKISFFNEYKEIFLNYENLFPDYEKKILLAIKSVLEDIKASIVVGVESSSQLKTIDRMLKLKKNKYLMADIIKSRKLWGSLPKQAIDPRKW